MFSFIIIRDKVYVTEFIGQLCTNSSASRGQVTVFNYNSLE